MVPGTVSASLSGEPFHVLRPIKQTAPAKTNATSANASEVLDDAANVQEQASSALVGGGSGGLWQRFEDGSVNFLSILSLNDGLDIIEHELGGIDNVHRYILQCAA